LIRRVTSRSTGERSTSPRRATTKSNVRLLTGGAV